MPNDLLSNIGLFLPTNFIYDVTSLNSIKDLNSPEFRELLLRLYQNINSMCIALNLKVTGYYYQPEFLTGKVFFPNPNDVNQQPRQGFMTLVVTGTLPNNSSISIPHGIDFDGSYSFFDIYGSGTDPIGLTAIPLPYVTSSGTGGIQVEVTATNVVITTTGNYSAYTVSYMVLEYLKN